MARKLIRKKKGQMVSIPKELEEKTIGKKFPPGDKTDDFLLKV